MKFQTKISATKNGEHEIYGRKVLDLMKEHSFVEVLFLLWRGSLPTKQEEELMNVLLVAAAENGIESPSTFVPRISASVGNPMHVALAASALSIGENHGGAGEKSAEILASESSPDEIVASHTVIPGFGHKIYKDEDPRATLIHEKAKELGFSCIFFDRAYAIEKKLAEAKGKKIPLNIDGAMAAAMLELGLNPKFGKALFLIARMVGAASHVAEEMEQGNSYHRLGPEDVVSE